jgi:phosphoribosylamine--glycine ligase
MKILVIGSGGREHALCQAFSRSEKSPEIFCADGNAGTAEIAERVNIKPDNIERLINFAVENKID